MSASILSRTINTVLDKGLVLANDYCARKIAIGTDWATVRIGFLLAINPNGSTQSIRGLRFLIGLCSGTQNPVGSASPGHFVGMNLGSNYDAPSELAYLPNSGYPYFKTGSPRLIRIASGVVEQQVSQSAFSFGIALPAQPQDRRLPIVLQITKHASIYGITTLIPTGNSSYADAVTRINIPLVDLITAMEGATMTNVKEILGAMVGSSYWFQEDSANGYSLTGTDASGPLDTINISWPIASRFLEIGAIVYARIA